jgi:hypothetical protein
VVRLPGETVGGKCTDGSSANSHANSNSSDATADSFTITIAGSLAITTGSFTIAIPCTTDSTADSDSSASTDPTANSDTISYTASTTC